MANTTILVVGGTGSIGRQVVRALSEQSDTRILVGTRDPQRAAAAFAHLPAAEPVAFDFSRPETVRAALDGVDKLALVNAMSPLMGQETRLLIAAARDSGVRHVVRSSLLGTDEPDPIEEAKWHAEADAVVQHSGIPYTILRPNQYFQNFINFGNDATVRDQGALFLPLCDSRVSNVDTRDIGAAAATVLISMGHEHEGKVYALTGGSSNTMAEVARAISEGLGKPVNYVAVTPGQYQQGLLAANVPAVIADGILGWFDYCRAGRADRIEPDLERLLGREPISLERFVQDHVAHYR